MAVTIATNDVSVIEMRFAPGQVTLRLPNRTLIDPVSHEFGGMKVLFDYQPQDDPADRAAYRRWLINPQDAESRRWYCTTMYPNLAPAIRENAAPCP